MLSVYVCVCVWVCACITVWPSHLILTAHIPDAEAAECGTIPKPQEATYCNYTQSIEFQQTGYVCNHSPLWLTFWIKFGLFRQLRTLLSLRPFCNILQKANHNHVLYQKLPEWALLCKYFCKLLRWPVFALWNFGSRLLKKNPKNPEREEVNTVSRETSIWRPRVLNPQVMLSHTSGHSLGFFSVSY